MMGSLFGVGGVNPPILPKGAWRKPAAKSARPSWRRTGPRPQDSHASRRRGVMRGTFKLQWGQHLSALNTDYAATIKGAMLQLQWGQRLSALDTHLGGGNRVADNDASMGPTPFSVGFNFMEQEVYQIRYGLQWGQRLSALDTSSALSATCRWATGGCNGANAFQRWIPWGWRRSGRSWKGCNGANAFQRWIHIRKRVDRAVSSGLQWGQLLSALDTQHVQNPTGPRIHAAMGPTPFSVGYVEGELEFWRTNSELQWGQRLSALDTPWTWTAKRIASSAIQVLQWGQRLSALDTRAQLHIAGITEKLQWGQRLSALDTPLRGAIPRRVDCRCNGANAFQRWILLGDGQGPSRIRRAAMGPTPFSVGYFQRQSRRRAVGDAAMGPTPFSVGYASSGCGADSPADTCCNGANAFQRWILHFVREPHRGGGRCNGANAFQRWILMEGDARQLAGAVLQWGQRLSALDTGRDQTHHWRGRGAAMGPTPFSVGYSVFAALFAHYSALGRTNFAI